LSYFNFVFINEIKVWQAQLQAELDSSRSQLSKLPKGNLIIHNQYTRKYYYHSLNGKRIYLSKSQNELKKQLATKKYMQHCIHYLENALNMCALCLKQPVSSILPPARFLAEHPEIKQLIFNSNLTPDDKVNEWVKRPYEQTELSENPDSVRSAAGHLVRSKSECIIADALLYSYIPYRYEEPLLLRNFKYYPDFTIIHPRTYKKIIWEHLGMMDNTEYAKNNRRKIHHYIDNGFIPGDNLIITTSHSATDIDSMLVRKIIEGYLT